MKKSIVFALLIVFAVTTRIAAQNIPQNVTDTLPKMYPEVTGIKWEVTDQGYIAKFKDEGSPVTVKFNHKGNWTETWLTVVEKELPSQALIYIKTNYFRKDPAFKIKSSHLVSKPTEKHYFVLIKKAGSKDIWELFFKTDGSFIKVNEPGVNEVKQD